MSEKHVPLTGVFDDRFEIVGEIGRGGSAFVYSARDLTGGGLVAIKVLRTELAESLAADRFEKEILRHQQLQHPNVIPVLDFGTSNGLSYCVLPLMEGGTLRARLDQEKQLSVVDAIAIARAVAVALAYVHKSGLVHRDVKPENILFSGGLTYLGDFGITRALENVLGETTTTTGVIRGTGAYMSPEQAAGEHHYDGRSDVYSLGCVMYEMLSGMQPFIGPTPQSVIAQRLAHDPRPVGVYRPEVPRGVVAVIDRAMKLTQSDRFQSAEEFIVALDGATKATELPTRAPPVARARWRSVLALSVVALAAVAVIVKLKTTTEPPLLVDIPDGDPRRIAVLYLENRSPDSLPSYVVNGITEDLIDQLGFVRALRVTSPDGVRPLRDHPVAPDSMARLLKVGTIVSGSVTKSGQTLKVSVRLIDAHTSQQLATIPLETRWDEVFAFQDTLAEKVAFALRKQLGDEIAFRANRVATRSLVAWEAAQIASDALRAQR